MFAKSVRSMYASVLACMYMYVCVGTAMVGMDIGRDVKARLEVCIHAYVQLYVQVYAQVCVHVYVHICSYAYVHIYIYIHR